MEASLCKEERERGEREILFPRDSFNACTFVEQPYITLLLNFPVNFYIVWSIWCLKICFNLGHGHSHGGHGHSHGLGKSFLVVAFFLVKTLFWRL